MSSLEPAVPKQSSLLASTSIISVMTFISRLSGYARDTTIAILFGASPAVDAFLVAFRIPNFMRRLFAEGAFSQAFVPVLSEYQATRTHEEVKQFVSYVSGNLACVLIVITLLATYFAPYLTLVFAPGFAKDPFRFSLASNMLRITFPYLMLISLTALAGALLNTYHRFAIPALTPTLLNLVMITAALFFSHFFKEPVESLAWGVLVAGIAQLLFQLPFLKRASLLCRPRISWSDPAVKRVLRLMAPALFGASVAQVNLIIDTLFASFLPVGSVTWLFFSDRLLEFPIGIFGVAIATVILPHLSRQYAKQSHAQFSNALDWGIRLMLLIALPSAVGLFLMAGPLLATLLGYGKFSAFDVSKARLSLMALAVGLPPFMLIKVLASGFYASLNIKTPVKIGLIAMLVNTLLCFLLIKPLLHAGLALSSSLAGYVNAGLLFYFLIKRRLFTQASSWGRFTLQLLFANLLLILWLLWKVPPTQVWVEWHWSTRIIELLLDVSVGALVYTAGLWIARMRVKDFRGKVFMNE